MANDDAFVLTNKFYTLEEYYCLTCSKGLTRAELVIFTDGTIVRLKYQIQGCLFDNCEQNENNKCPESCDIVGQFDYSYSDPEFKAKMFTFYNEVCWQLSINWLEFWSHVSQ